MSTGTATSPDDLPIKQASRWRRRRVFVLAGIGLFLVAGLAYVVPVMLVVRDLTTPDRRPLTTTPAALGLAYEDITFPARGEDITLRGWWLPSSGPQTVIIVHGVNGVRDDPKDRFLWLGASLVNLGYHVLIFDLRAHGESDSAPFTLGTLEWRDVLGAVDFSLSRGTPAGKIAVVGFSSGAAASLEAAVREPAIGAVVADGVWPDLTEVLDDEVPDKPGLPAIYNPGIYLAIQLRYGADVFDADPIDDVATLAATGRPLFLVHEADDKYTDASEAQQLDAAANGAPQVISWWVDGATHVRAYATFPDDYLARLSPFLANAVGSASGAAALTVVAS